VKSWFTKTTVTAAANIGMSDMKTGKEIYSSPLNITEDLQFLYPAVY
jgi:hypothetical protein